ncbi:MAG: hypothetical protein ABIG39_05175 [Candidatus Micrarchaeota archaeon]
MKKKLISLLLPAIAFAQNATGTTTEYLSPYHPFINSPYMASAIILVRDITIIVVLWVILFKFYEKHKAK